MSTTMPSLKSDSSSKGTRSSQENDSKFVAMNSIMSHLHIHMSIKAAIDLGIPDILFKAGGKPLTAEEIIEQLPVKSREPGSDSVRKLVCILRFLVLDGFFTKSLNDKKQPVYGPTEISNWFVNEKEFNLLPFTKFGLRLDVMDSFVHLSKTVLDDAIVPFEVEHEMPLYEYPRKHPDFGSSFQGLMTTWSDLEIASLLNSLRSHAVLDGVETLVDVGGGTGSNVAEIIANYPHIKGINYDLPHIIAQAPERKGVTSIAGDMFETVPAGDAMFVKWILHNYDDELAIVILKNCFNGLPSKNGKAIICEYVLSDDDNDWSPKNMMGYNMDFNMIKTFKGARERTKAQYEELIVAAGFSRSESILDPGALDLIIAYKE